jgi:hypothetical protein
MHEGATHESSNLDWRTSQHLAAVVCQINFAALFMSNDKAQKVPKTQKSVRFSCFVPFCLLCFFYGESPPDHCSYRNLSTNKISLPL